MYTVGDGCGSPQTCVDAQKAFNPPGQSPFMCSECYTGWLTHWGEGGANTSSSAPHVESILGEFGGSISLYVVDAVCFVYTCRRLIELANDCRYGTSFELPASLPADAQVSVNLTVSTRPAPPARIDLGLLKERLLLRDRPWQGFGQGNLFMNGVHVAYFNTEDGR